MYRDVSALLAAKELDLQVADAKIAELRTEVERLTARVEMLEKELAETSGPTNRDAVLEGAMKRSEDLERDNRRLAEQVSVLRERTRRGSVDATNDALARALEKFGDALGRVFKR